MTMSPARRDDLQNELQARTALAEEWDRAAPVTPEEIAAFYRSAEGIRADLNAWHKAPDRAEWTRITVHVARSIGVECVVDIGCGAGHDLLALRDAGIPLLFGVEPNEALARNLNATAGIARVYPSVDEALPMISTADMLLCFDVLEHVVDPEAFIERIAQTAKIGALLLETTATFDCGTPLHLRENRGWHPGRALDKHGWKLLDERERFRVWKREADTFGQTASALLVAYRSCSIPTMESMLKLQHAGWRIKTKWGDGLIARARSILVSRWWQECNDDVFLMLDDDIVFDAESAERLVERCREGKDIICAAYPVRDGGHLAIRGLGTNIEFAPDKEPIEIRYAATGFLAVHRRVLDAMIPTLPLCHGNQPWAFWPLFDTFVIEDEPAGGHNYLSEDWAFVEQARQLGFKVWLDPSIRLGHLSQVELSVINMAAVHRALKDPLAQTKEVDNGRA